MSHVTVPLKLVPPGSLVDRHGIGAEGIIVDAHGSSATSPCPACGLPSTSVHSRYQRSLGDFPAHGRRLEIQLTARRFRCRNATCVTTQGVPRSAERCQAPMVPSTVLKVLASEVMRAVATTVRTAASPLADHVAR